MRLSFPFAVLATLSLACAADAAHAAVRDAAHGITVDRSVAPHHRGAETLHAVRLDRRDFQANAVAGRALDLPGTGNAPMRARFVRAQQQGDNYTWVGKVDTDIGEQAAVVTIGPDAVFGTIPQAHGQPLRIESRAGRAWLVEGHGRDPMAGAGADDARIQKITKQASLAAAVKPLPVHPATVAPVIDVLVAYTPSIVSRLGSDAAVQTRIAYLEQLANQAFMDTPAMVRIHVVASKLLNYTAASSNATLLDLITNPSSNATKAQVDAWRTQYAADLVVALRAFDGATQVDCGQGWIGGYHGAAYVETTGFSVVADGSSGGSTCPDDAFAHQLGHNLGGQHDIDTAGGDWGAGPSSRGYRHTIDATTGFATVLATPVAPQVRLNQFSNAYLWTCMQIQECGDETGHMAGTLDDAGWRVASYRGASVGKQPDVVVDMHDATAVLEGNSGTKVMTFRLTLSEVSPNPVSVLVYTNTPAPGMVNPPTPGVDYVAIPWSTVVIPAGATYLDVPVTILGDTVQETDEQVELFLSGVTGAVAGNRFGYGLITNDDPARVYIDDTSANEGSPGYPGRAYVNVRVAGYVTTPITFTIQTVSTAGAATAGVDYVALPPTVKTFEVPWLPVDHTSMTIEIPMIGDTQAETSEAFVVTLSGVTGAVVGDGAAKVTIINDDNPTLSLLSDVSVVEGNSGTKYAVFTASLSVPTDHVVTFDYSTSGFNEDNMASGDQDYDYLYDTNASIPAGQLSKTFSIPVYGDTTLEGNEKFPVSISNIQGAQLGTGTRPPYTSGVATATGWILNDDPPAISINDATITEGNSGSQLLSFTIRLSGPSAVPVYFDIGTVAQGTATAGVDYAARTLANVGIPAGQTMVTFKVGIAGDAMSEDNETFAVALSNVRGATVADGDAIGAILNDDPVLWRIADATLVEGNSGTRQMTFVLSLTSTANQDLSAYVTAGPTTGATATAGSDYTATAQQVTIPKGLKSVAFNVPILPDTVPEANEVFVVTLSNTGGVGIADGAARGTITNDD